MLSSALWVLLAARGPAPAPAPPTLVGDYETPDAVALVFSESWTSSFRRMTIALASEVPVVVFRESIADPGAMRRAIARLPRSTAESVHVLGVSVDTPWVRDWGPLQMRTGGRVTWLDAPYATDRSSDDIAPQLLGERYGIDVQGLPASIDGGAVASNGRGLCVMTLEYRDAYAGGAGLDPESLGCRTVAVVPALANDETMHADMFIQFVSPEVAVLAEVDPWQDVENADRLEFARETILEAAEGLGQALELVRLPMSPIGTDGNYRPYANFFRVGSVVLVPTYRRVDRHVQAQAHAVLRRVMPDARHVPIAAERIADVGGSVHCVTLGLWLGPRGLRDRWPIDEG